MPNDSFDLLSQIDQLMVSWDIGIQAYETGWQRKCSRPTIDELLEVAEAVNDDIVEHRNVYNIVMSNYDCNKVTNYFAWHVLKKFGDKFSTGPLFFGHLHFIDESIRTASLFSIPHLPLIAENLETFHRQGHKLAPYTFLKGVDLTFTFCFGDGAR